MWTGITLTLCGKFLKVALVSLGFEKSYIAILDNKTGTRQKFQYMWCFFLTQFHSLSRTILTPGTRAIHVYWSVG